MILCDTSIVAKFYVPESESLAVRRLLEGESEVFLSELVRVELMSVFHRYLREKIWNEREFLAMVHQFSQDDLSGFWTWLPLDSAITGGAARTFFTLPGTVFLRASDCVHLVTALHHGFEGIYTYDRHQSKAASVLGLKAMTA